MGRSYQHGGWAQARELIVDKVATNTLDVLQRARRAGVTPREAAEELARSRVVEAMGYRRR